MPNTKRIPSSTTQKGAGTTKNCTYKLNNRPGVINSNDEMMKNENGKA